MVQVAGWVSFYFTLASQILRSTAATGSRYRARTETARAQTPSQISGAATSLGLAAYGSTVGTQDRLRFEFGACLAVPQVCGAWSGDESFRCFPQKAQSEQQIGGLEPRCSSTDTFALRQHIHPFKVIIRRYSKVSNAHNAQLLF